PRLEGVDQLPGKSNYFYGNDSKKWRIGVPHYARVKYNDVYPGIDAVFYGNGKQMEYDFVINAGADPSMIELAFDGADKISINDRGDLVLNNGQAQIVQHKPVVYQDTNGHRRSISASYILREDRHVAIQLGDYDKTKVLVIDPVLAYSTYLGGTGQDEGRAIAVDSSGNAYITGQTNSVDFPNVGAFQSANHGSADAYITKLSADGSTILYSTYLGGTGSDIATSIAVDSSGNAYVTGSTTSSDFPLANAFQGSFGTAVRKAFVTKLSASGSSLLYSTYLGGVNDTEGNSIAVDISNSAYITGSTTSPDFPTSHAFQPNLIDNFGSAFVTKFSSDGSSLVYSTYLGGHGIDDFGDVGNAIALDTLGHAYVTGETSSSDFPTMNSIQSRSTAPTNESDAFVTKFSTDGTSLVYSTFLGGSGNDTATAIALDPSRNAYVTGFTFSNDFPIANAFQSTFSGDDSAFVTAINAAGSSMIYSTYLIGPSGSGLPSSSGSGIAVDSMGEAVVTGTTSAPHFPVVNAITTPTGNNDEFVEKFSTNGSGLLFSTLLGGSQTDSGNGVALDNAGNVYVVGSTSSIDFKTANAEQATLKGFTNAFVAKLSETVLLADNFDSDTIDPSKWAISIFSGTQDRTVPVRDLQGQLRIGPLESNTPDSHYNGVTSANTVNLSGGYAQVFLVRAAATNVVAYTMFTIGLNASNYYRFYETGSTLTVQKKINGVKTDVLTIPYDPNSFTYLRIRNDASKGLVVFEISPADANNQPTNWTALYSEPWNTTTVPLDQIQMEMKAGTSDAENNPLGKAIFDNFRAAIP